MRFLSRDNYYCCEHLHKVTTLLDGDHPARQQAWYEATMARLFWGEGHGIIWGLQRMKPMDAQAAEEVGTRIGYLQRHQERVDYRFAHKGGYPMGSGGPNRPTRSLAMCASSAPELGGTATRANQMLALRCAK